MRHQGSGPSGTAASYNNGCRCKACTQANAEKTRRGYLMRAERLAKGEVNPPHGSVSTYFNYGCHCAACRAAGAAYARKRRAAAKQGV